MAVTKHPIAPKLAPHPCGGKSNPALSAVEIATVLSGAGFPQKDGGIPHPNLPDALVKGSSNPLVVGVAIVLAESGGHLCSRNTNTNGSHDRGPWQFNDRAHPEVSDDCAFNIFCASQAAFRTSKGGTDYTAWTTYNTRKYSVFLPTALEAVKQTPAGTGTAGNIFAAGGNVAAGIGDAASAIPNFIGLLTKGSTWARVGMFVGGGALALMAVRGLARRFDQPGIANAANSVLSVPKKLTKAASK